jgi:hypothetical protein
MSNPPASAVPILQIGQTNRAPFVERSGGELADRIERHQARDSAAAAPLVVNRCSWVFTQECSDFTRLAAEMADDNAESSAD